MWLSAIAGEGSPQQMASVKQQLLTSLLCHAQKPPLWCGYILDTTVTSAPPCTSADSSPALQQMSQTTSHIPSLLLSWCDWDEHFLGPRVLWTDAFQEIITLLEDPSRQSACSWDGHKWTNGIDNASALRKLTVKNLNQGYLIHF